MSKDLNYQDPRQGYDWSLENAGDGKAVLIWDGNGQEMYIGDIKENLLNLIKRLDKAADSWGVPNNLDVYGRAR